MSERRDQSPDRAPDLTRRTIVAGAAWSTPVLMVAAAAPALAASPAAVSVNTTAPGCTFATHPAKHRRAVLTFVNPGPPVAVVITGITEDGNPVTSYSPGTFTPTSAGVSVTVLFTTGDANTHNRTLEVTYTVGGGTPITTSVTVTGLATTCA